MLPAAVRDGTCVQLLLDAKQQKCQGAESAITDFRRWVGRHSSLVDSASASLHSNMPHALKTCLQSLLSKVARRICRCEAEYQSDVDTQLGTYDSTIQHGVSSILATPYHRREEFCRDYAPGNPR